MPRASVVDRRLEEMSSGWKPWSISGTPTASPVMYVLVTHTRTHISWCRKNTPTVLCVTMSNKGGRCIFENDRGLRLQENARITWGLCSSYFKTINTSCAS